MENLPTGLIIGVCKLENCLKIIEDNQTYAILDDGQIVSGNDYYKGGFRLGNYEWEVQERGVLEQLFLQKEGLDNGRVECEI